MGNSKRFIKAAGDIVDYAIPWSDWLVSDTISVAALSCTWTVPAGITSVLQTNSTTTATIWLSGGTSGAEYDLVNRIVTAGGRTKYCTITIVIE